MTCTISTVISLDLVFIYADRPDRPEVVVVDTRRSALGHLYEYIMRALVYNIMVLYTSYELRAVCI